MAEHDASCDQATTGANAPKYDHVYAVFDSRGEAEQAEHALTVAGFAPLHLQPYAAADVFKEPTSSAHPLAKLERFTKRLGGETHDAERYAQHLDHGRTLLSVEAKNRDAAVRIAGLVEQHGGYDVTYFAPLATEYMSPQANARHGLNTYATTNVDDAPRDVLP
jgi:hypothetical protein